MSYIGNPLTQGFDYIDKQTFTGDGATSSFTMRDPVGKEEIIEVFVGGVRQEPGVAYTTNGYNLNFTGTPALGDTIYVVNNNSPIRLNEPPLDSIATANLKDNAVTAAKILDGTITQAKLDSSVSSGGSLFKGNNGTVGNASNIGDIFRVNATTLSTNTQINTTENASAAGPITIAASTVLTVNGHLSIL
jgi:hypothetical protein